MPAEPGSLLKLADPSALPLAQGPAPVLEPADVVDPPLPHVTISSPGASASSIGSSTNSGAKVSTAISGLCLLVIGLSVFLVASSQ